MTGALVVEVIITTGSLVISLIVTESNLTILFSKMAITASVRDVSDETFTNRSQPE